MMRTSIEPPTTGNISKCRVRARSIVLRYVHTTVRSTLTSLCGEYTALDAERSFWSRLIRLHYTSELN